MEVHVLTKVLDWEGSDTLGVFSTIAKAASHVEDLEPGRKLRWDVDQEFNSRTCRPIRDGTEGYAIQTFVVDRVD